MSINKDAISEIASFSSEMEPEKLPRDDDKTRQQYTSLPLLTGASTRDASLQADSGLGSANPLENCVCKDNLKKYATLPMIGIALLLLTNTAITITQHQGGTSVNFCRNFTLPIDVFTPPTIRSVEEKKSNETIKFQGPAKNCLAQNSFHLEGDIYASVCRHRGSVLLDIRRFIDQSQGLLPTVRGIFLSPEQWNVLKTKVDFIDRSFQRVEDGLDLHGR